MKIKIEGTRNGVRWPEVGGTVDLPENEANDLVSQGFAVAVEAKKAAKPEPEKAVAAKPETRKKS